MSLFPLLYSFPQMNILESSDLKETIFYYPDVRTLSPTALFFLAGFCLCYGSLRKSKEFETGKNLVAQELTKEEDLMNTVFSILHVFV